MDPYIVMLGEVLYHVERGILIELHLILQTQLKVEVSCLMVVADILLPVLGSWPAVIIYFIIQAVFNPVHFKKLSIHVSLSCIPLSNDVQQSLYAEYDNFKWLIMQKKTITTIPPINTFVTIHCQQTYHGKGQTTLILHRAKYQGRAQSLQKFDFQGDTKIDDVLKSVPGMT